MNSAPGQARRAPRVPGRAGSPPGPPAPAATISAFGGADSRRRRTTPAFHAAAPRAVTHPPPAPAAPEGGREGRSGGGSGGRGGAAAPRTKRRRRGHRAGPCGGAAWREPGRCWPAAPPAGWASPCAPPRPGCCCTAWRGGRAGRGAGGLGGGTSSSAGRGGSGWGLPGSGGVPVVVVRRVFRKGSPTNCQRRQEVVGKWLEAFCCVRWNRFVPLCVCTERQGLAAVGAALGKWETFPFPGLAFLAG